MVEDNTDVTEVTSALMKQLGYTVRIATDAGKALRMMEEESFDLVFSDINAALLTARYKSANANGDGLVAHNELGSFTGQLLLVMLVR